MTTPSMGMLYPPTWDRKTTADHLVSVPDDLSDAIIDIWRHNIHGFKCCCKHIYRGNHHEGSLLRIMPFPGCTLMCHHVEHGVRHMSEDRVPNITTGMHMTRYCRRRRVALIYATRTQDALRFALNLGPDKVYLSTPVYQIRQLSPGSHVPLHGLMLSTSHA